MNTKTGTVTGKDPDPFLDQMPDEVPLDYENDNTSDSEWEQMDLFDDLQEGGYELGDEDDDLMGGTG